jgi:hypothetical protein
MGGAVSGLVTPSAASLASLPRRAARDLVDLPVRLHDQERSRVGRRVESFATESEQICTGTPRGMWCPSSWGTLFIGPR